MLRYLICILIFFCLLPDVAATHNRAGEISFVQTDVLTIRMTITTYTKTSSTAADRDSLEVFWGDGTSEFVTRSNGEGENIGNDVKINYYIEEHTYPGLNTYTISFMDPNRVDNILNVNPPNSVDVPFYLETSFTFLNSQFQGINNSPILLQAPLDFACVGQRFIHNPNAYDADGDSLAYELIVPLMMEDTPVPDYSFPDQIAPGFDNQANLNPITGDFIWDAPKLQGEYNIAIRINEYRNGVLISSLVRDMQIFVRTCENDPPTIAAIPEICVVAGELIDLDLTIDDPNIGQQVILFATGGPFQQTISPAELTMDSVYTDIEYSANFRWQTSCEHISDQEYQIVFRAVDDFFGNVGLATLKTLRIKVVGPPPENLLATSENDSVKLEWDFPYACQNAANDYFQGFSVWRKLLSSSFSIDTCETGLDGRGYSKIEFNTRDNDGMNFFYFDDNVENGKTYCYRILAEFALSTATGNPFNRVESLASNEVCLQLRRDLPLITEVSVTDTDLINGAMAVSWTKPLLSDFDTLMHPGPYTYKLRGGTDANNLQTIPGAEFTSTFFNEMIDTSYNHSGINTLGEQHFYQVEFYTGVNQELFGTSQVASSVFINTQPNDERITISWDYVTPWQNYSFTVFRFNDLSSTFDSIGVSMDNSYTDLNLINGQEYCYKVKAVGTYGLENVIDPLINYSQERCSSPIDITPPCPPILLVESICEKLENITSPEELINSLFWNNVNIECPSTDDVAFYTVFISFDEGQSFEEIGRVDGAININFEHLVQSNQLGCYAVSATDFNGNESERSNVICVENCPLYDLPNTFTPNGDGSNDLFIPTKNIFVDRIDFKVYNKWGNLVFETTDPLINWNGTNLDGKQLAEGTYYYSCRVFELQSGGLLQGLNNLSGFIHIIRG